MKFLLAAALLVATVAAPPPPDQRDSPVINEIVVRVLSGQNGKPIKHQPLGSRLGSDLQKNRTDDNGEVVISIGGSQAREIEVWLINFYIDCATYGNEDGQNPRFSLDEIASRGITGENRCGRNQASPAPGVLIVYARKMTRKERRLV
jgi:hypothetical protein